MSDYDNMFSRAELERIRPRLREELINERMQRERHGESMQRVQLRDVRLTPVDAQGRPISNDPMRIPSGHMEFQIRDHHEQAEGLTTEKMEQVSKYEDLRTVDYGPDKGTTELWLKGQIATMTVDGIYYNRWANQGEEGYSQGPSSQPLFQLKEPWIPETPFIYDEFGYVDGTQEGEGTSVCWDSPFRWRSEGKPMKPMMELTDEDMVSDKVLMGYV